MAAGSPQEVTVVEDLFAPDTPSGEEAAPLPSDSASTDGAAVRRYAHTMRSGRHTLRGDLMPAAGGFDAGPSPKELALLALGLCTSMTVRVFADNSRFPLRRVGVTVRERCPPGAHVPEGVEVEIRLQGELSQAQRERLVRAAAKCPVKQMFAGASPITTTLAPEGTDV